MYMYIYAYVSACWTMLPRCEETLVARSPLIGRKIERAELPALQSLVSEKTFFP